MDGAAIARAVDAIEITCGYRFLHDWLVVQGFIEARPGGLHLSRWDTLPESGLFLAWAGSKLVAVQAAVPEGQDKGLPSAGPFYIEIGNLRRRGSRLCELGMSAVTPALQKSVLPAEMIRCCVAHAVAAGCSQVVATVDPSKARQYSDWGFSIANPIRVFSSDMPFPAVLASLDLEALARAGGESEVFAGGLSPRDYYIDRNPYLRHAERWSVQAGDTFGSAEFLRELFVRRSGLLERCNEEELATICREWGRSLFDQVWTGPAIPAWRSEMSESEPTTGPRVAAVGRRGPASGSRPRPQRGNPSPVEMHAALLLAAGSVS
ncbi:MAG: hypothetical protein WC869_03415 [Phycisphaerae bacterium]